MAKQKTQRPTTIETVNVGAAAVEIGSREHMAGVNPDVTDAPIRAFGTFTYDLHDLAAWFKTHGVTSIAMESTGVYWIPAYEILEQHGFEVILVNARYAKNVPGRKTDVSDACWLRQLHSYGLLRGSFRPSAQIATLRAYLRQRERLVEYAAAHIQHMQKALMEMNLQLHHVVSDITGVTGMRIIRAIVAGERDLDVLASFRDVRCRASVETIKAALNGNDRSEHIFALTQSLELYDFYQSKMLECDRHLEVTLATLAADQEHDFSKLPKVRTKRKQVNTPSFDVRAALFGLLGVDLTQIHGMGPSLSLKLVGECGTDLRAWPSAKHFTSWLCLTGQQDIGWQSFIVADQAIFQPGGSPTTFGRSHDWTKRYRLSAFYRRLAARAGKAKAVTATARKIAVLFYNTLRHGMTYQDPGASHYEERYRNRVLGNLKRRAKSFGYDLQELPPEADMAVS
jgi:transposase